LDGTTPLPKNEIARRLPRHETDNRVILTVPKPDGAETVRGRASNISEAGFGAVLAGELPVGEVVHAKLVLRSLAEPLEVQAQVKNRHGFTHGFAFVDITSEHRRTIMRYLREAAHEDIITPEDAHAMNTQHTSEPHETMGKSRISPDAYAPKPDGQGESPDMEAKKEDGGE
jgi:hypothetical protein